MHAAAELECVEGFDKVSRQWDFADPNALLKLVIATSYQFTSKPLAFCPISFRDIETDQALLTVRPWRYGMLFFG